MSALTKPIWIALALGGIAVAAPLRAADGDREVATSINNANALLRNGDLKGALEAYQNVRKSTANNTDLSYDLGVAQYRKGDLAGAERNFSEAAHATSDPLAAKARYNLGNCSYAEALRQSETDHAAAIAGFDKAINNYRNALELDPTDVDARANIELASAMIDKLRQQDQQQQNQQDQQKNQQKIQQQKQDQSQKNQKDSGQSGDQSQKDQPQRQDKQQNAHQPNNSQQQEQQNKDNKKNDEQQNSSSQSQQKDGSQDKQSDNQNGQKSDSQQKHQQESNSSQQPDSKSQDKDNASKSSTSSADQRKDSDQKQQQDSQGEPKPFSDDQQSKASEQSPQNSAQQKDQQTSAQRQANIQHSPQNDPGQPSDAQDQNGSAAPKGALTTNKQDAATKKQEAGQAASETEGAVDGPMTKQEAEKMLQAIRDQEMVRRLRRQAVERNQHIPVDRDW